MSTIYNGVHYETRALLEHWNFCAKNIEEAWDLLNCLAWDTYEFEASGSNSYILPPCIHNYAPPVCEIHHYFGHDNNFCPYYISTDSFTRLTSTIETMNE